MHAVSTGANNFVNSYRASQNFLASSGQKNYLGKLKVESKSSSIWIYIRITHKGQQGGLQAAAWAGAGAAAAGFNYDSIATGKHLPSNVAGYQGFPSYGR